jgi:hypothetical protein
MQTASAEPYKDKHHPKQIMPARQNKIRRMECKRLAWCVIRLEGYASGKYSGFPKAGKPER